MKLNLSFFMRILLLLALLLAGLPQGKSPVRATSPEALSASQIKRLLPNTPVADAGLGGTPDPGTGFYTSVALSIDIAVVGAPLTTVNGAANHGVAYVFYRNFTNGIPGDWQFVKTLTASDGDVNDRFGNSVAVSGDRIFVGATYGGDGSGAVYVFERNTGGGNTWGQTKIITPGISGLLRFGTSLAASGDTIVVGAPLAPIGAHSYRGSAFVFSRNQGGADNWGQVTLLTASDHAEFDDFGASVSIFTDMIAVGSPQADISGQVDQGAVYIYYRNQGAADGWGFFKKVTAIDGAEGDHFGRSVSLNSGVLAVGAPFDDSPSLIDQGSVYLLNRNTGGINNWGQLAQVRASDGDSGDLFGLSVALRGNLLAVGAPYDDRSSLTNPGAAYVFESNTGGADTWGQIQKVTVSDGLTNDTFGFIALDGNNLLVAAPGYDATSPATTNSGAAYIIALQGTGWAQTAKAVSPVSLASSNEGLSISLFGEYLVTGAPYYDVDSVSNTGQAYLYRRNEGSADGWDLFKNLDAPTPTADTLFGQSVSIWDDTIAVSAPGTGKVYIFLRNNGGADGWTLFRTINGPTGEKFGNSIKLVGDLLAIGAPAYNGNTGRVYIHERNKNGSETWGLVATQTGTTAGDQFGFSVDLDTSALIVGAPYADSAVTDSGKAYLHLRNEGGADSWGQFKELSATGGAAEDHFGWAVAISDDTVLVGAPDKDTTLADVGAFYVFSLNQGGANIWGQRFERINPQGTTSDRFGFSLDLNGDVALVGNPRASVYGKTAQGSASVFERNAGGADQWEPAQRLFSGDGRADDRFGYAVALNDRFLAISAATADDGEVTNRGATYVYQLDQAFTLNLVWNGAASGRVNDNQSILSCDSTTCQADYRAGTIVTLTATPASGHVFTGWSGACAGTRPCTVTMSQARTVLANFQPTYTLTVNKSGAGAGTVTSAPAGIDCGTDCSEIYPGQTSVTLTATAEPGSTFVRFISADPDCTDGNILMDSDITCHAIFELTGSASIPSTASHDGWILESTETSGKGGTKNNTASTIQVGDDASDRQYVSILSFNTTSLPANAVITSVTLKIKSAGVSGTNPFKTHNGLTIDIRSGFLGTKSALELVDFNAASGKGVANFGKTAVNGWYSLSLPASAFNYITPGAGLTQFRLRFLKDDNDDKGADFIKFYSANAPTGKPILIINYYLSTIDK